jgi:ribonuclease P protein component
VLEKKWRIVKEQDIKKTYFSRFKSSTLYSQIYLRKTNIQNFQLLVVVSKKVFKKANKRNRVRRKIEAVFEDLKHKNRLPSGTSCIVQVKNKEVLLQDKNQIEQDILPKISDLFKKTLLPISTNKYKSQKNNSPKPNLPK